MGSGFGALNCLTNAARVFDSMIPSHFAVEKATKKIMDQSMIVINIQSNIKLRSLILKTKFQTKHNYSDLS